MTRFANVDLDELASVLKQRGLDGWLVYDFHDLNPIARRLLTTRGMMTRRVFIWLPAVGPPQLVVHGIDRPAIVAFPGETRVYSTWQDLHQAVADLVRGRRVAVETSPENAVPYLDLIPHGVVELLGRLGATLVSSAPLITQFASRWSPTELEDHRYAAEAIARIARETVTRVVGQVGIATEWDVQQQVLADLAAVGLKTEEPPIVAFGPNSANPHYAPEESDSRTLEADQVMLLDLWARRSEQTVWADQTWMGFSGTEPPADVRKVWSVVREARDAAVDRLNAALKAGEKVAGGMLDTVARGVIVRHGYGEYFTHRTGHSIDLGLHGSGPHIDDFETHDMRELIPGVAFSIEPGLYLTGRFGVRSEINVVLGSGVAEVTPRDVQQALLTS